MIAALADSDKLKTFCPPQRSLLGAGPSEIDPRVLVAMSRPIIGHLDPAFIELMEQIKLLMRYAFQTENPLTFPVSGPGSVGMESCIVNLVEPGDKVIIGRNGVFGGRMVEIVERCGGVPIVVSDNWGEPVDPNKLEDALKRNPDARIVVFVHAETSTGCTSDAKLLTKIAHDYGRLVIADTVTSLGGMPVFVDDWGIDAVFSASQKCLSCTPGLSPVSFSERAVDYVKNRRQKVQSWFMDLGQILNYWGATNRTYHHTAPISSLFGLHEALLTLRREGLENAWTRHRTNQLALEAGLQQLGLKFLVAPEFRLPALTAVHVPAGIDERAVRDILLKDFSLEIGAGLGPLAGKVWRIGLMGYSSAAANVALCVFALGSALERIGLPVRVDDAVAAMQDYYDTVDVEARLARRSSKSPILAPAYARSC